MPYVLTADLRIEYARGGSGREPVLFLHGNFGSWRWWEPILDRVPPGFSAYAPVLRGCGETSGPLGNFSVADLAEDIERFADALGLVRFHLVGHSLGGAVALALALSRPQRVKSLLLVAPSPADGLTSMRQGNGELARALRAIDPGHGPTMLALFAMRWFARSYGLDRFHLERMIRRMVPLPHPSAPTIEVLARDAARMTPEAFVGFLRALDDFDVREPLSRFERPLLILAGGRDRIVPLAALERMASMPLRGEIRIWPNAGHAPQLESPDEFAALLAEHVRRHRWPLDLGHRWRLLRLRLAELLSRLERDLLGRSPNDDADRVTPASDAAPARDASCGQTSALEQQAGSNHPR